MTNSIITGCGSYLPKKILTNRDLEKMVETSDEWVVERTGIRQRHIVAEGETTSDMATAAAKLALEDAGLKAEDIDLLIVATTTPDRTFPATATIVQGKLAMNSGFAFDIQAVCSGFVYALTVADKFIKSGEVKKTLIIGADSMSRIIDWSDRNTCVLFGDGAGAIVLQASQQNKRGIIASSLHSQGGCEELLMTSGGTSFNQQAGVVEMAGREVFKQAVIRMSESIVEILAAIGKKPADLDWLIAHQANARILQMVAKKLGISEEKTVITLDKHSNTSSASIPLALDKVRHQIKAGDLVVFEAFGAGFTWGAVAVRW